MNADIVPISYIGGTGGNFLCHFIVAAKYNDYNKYKLHLSAYGNAHGNGADIPIAPYAPYDSDDKKIEYFLSYAVENDKIKPYYTLGHVVDSNLIHKNFAKSIRITYDDTDIDELTTVFLGKYISDSKKLIKNKLSIFIPSMRFQLVKYNINFTYQDNQSMLCISWKEIYQFDSTILINKLSTFTNIPAQNFSLDQLNQWRNATTNGVDLVNDMLQKES